MIYTDKSKIHYIEKKHCFREKKRSIFQTNFNSTCSVQLWCMLPCLAKNNKSEQRTAVRLLGQHELHNIPPSDRKLTTMPI